MPTLQDFRDLERRVFALESNQLFRRITFEEASKVFGLPKTTLLRAAKMRGHKFQKGRGHKAGLPVAEMNKLVEEIGGA